MDSKADFSKYYEFISGEDRYRTLKQINPEHYNELLEENKTNAEERFIETVMSSHPVVLSTTKSIDDDLLIKATRIEV